MQAGSKASLPVLFSLFGTLLFAQSTTQSIHGVAGDSAGAPVNVARVTVHDLGTNVVTFITTHESGNLTNPTRGSIDNQELVLQARSVSKANEKGSL